MQFSTAIFMDSNARPALEQFYEKKKTDVLDTLKAREADPSFKSSFEAQIKMPDGTTKTLTGYVFTSEMAEKSFVSFDEWLEITAQTYESGNRMMEMAQKRLDALQTESPDTSSGVRSTFSSDGQLLAYINADGSLVTSNIGPKHDEKVLNTPIELRLQSIVQQADAMGLTGQNRINYLNREIKSALSKEFGTVDVTSYSESTSPSKREFSRMWHHNFDVDQVYNDALADAQASYASAKSWHDQWQSDMNEMRSYILSLQEVV